MLDLIELDRDTVRALEGGAAKQIGKVVHLVLLVSGQAIPFTSFEGSTPERPARVTHTPTEWLEPEKQGRA
jgi:hypothetical protein